MSSSSEEEDKEKEDEDGVVDGCSEAYGSLGDGGYDGGGGGDEGGGSGGGDDVEWMWSRVRRGGASNSRHA